MDHYSTLSGQSAISKAAAFIQDWVTVESFCEQFPNIPKKTLKWQLTTRQQNGLEPHVQVIGKQRYISIKGYAAWLAQQAGQTSPTTH